MSRLVFALVLLVTAPAWAQLQLSVGDVTRPARDGEPGAIFQVAGDVVAALGPTGLCLIDADGKERGCAKDASGPFAFAPDGRTLAFVVRGAVFSWDVSSGARRRVVGPSGVEALSWSSDGLVVRRRIRGQRLLSVVTGSGERRLGRAELFATGGPTVARFVRGQLCAPACVALLDGDPVLRAAVSADGARVLFATARRVYLRDAAGAVSLVAEAPGVRSLAFSADGARYLWGSVAGGTLQTAEGKVSLPGASQIVFRGELLVLATDDGAVTLDARSGARQVVGGLTRPEGVTLAADLIAATPVVLALRQPARKVRAPSP